MLATETDHHGDVGRANENLAVTRGWHSKQLPITLALQAVQLVMTTNLEMRTPFFSPLNMLERLNIHRICGC
jgi:hypothetical protein